MVCARPRPMVSWRPKRPPSPRWKHRRRLSRMLHVGQYVFKQADTPDEFAQIHSLNYRTFVGEIPQHPDPGTGRLIDKFHGKNTYQIVLRAGRVVGMLSTHGQPPFSVAERLPDPSILTRPGTRPLEVRLLAIDPGERNSTLFLGLIY